MNERTRLSRRTVLKGLGVTLALPLLEVMKPLRALSDGTTAVATGAPTRALWVYVPNGIHMAEWTPQATGTSYEFKRIMQPLIPLKDKLNVMTGLEAKQADALGDGGGDHARAQSTYLTGMHAYKTDGSNIRIGTSIDQYIAQRVGNRTRLPSLEIGADQSNFAGSCDTNYSCAYNSNLSWRSPTQPQPKTNNPRVVFERLFSTGNNTERDRVRRSVLDLVMEDTRSMENLLGTQDRRKLEEYMSAVRDIERRIQIAEQMPPAQNPDYPQPTGIPPTYEDHLRLLSDLVVLAFQTDSTRISTFVYANESSNRPYPWIGVREGHHDLSHHQRNATKMEKVCQINCWHMLQFTYLLNRLNSVSEGQGTLLDNCMVVYGSGNSDGDRHNHDDLPTILAGKGAGSIAAGRHVRFNRGTPIANLWIAMANRMGVNLNTFGDSTGVLNNLQP